MDGIYKSLREKFEKAIEYCREELLSIRTGKASPAILETRTVLAYGGTTKLRMQELAKISITGPGSLLINPFDPATVQDIEKAILASPLGLTPRVDGKTIHITIPALSEDQRLKYQKMVRVKIEESKNTTGIARDDARKQIKQLFEDKEITEDDKFTSEKEIDKITHDYSARLDEMKEKKDRELMEV